MSDIGIDFPWYVLPLVLLLHWPFGLGVLLVALLVAGIPAFVLAALLGRPLIDRCSAPPRGKPRTRTRRRRIR